MSQPPNVPNIYQWKDPVSGEMILNLNHRNGYGGWHTFDVNLRGISHFKEMVVIPGYSEAMLVAFNDDNQGPYQSGWLSTISTLPRTSSLALKWLLPVLMSFWLEQPNMLIRIRPVYLF